MKRSIITILLIAASGFALNAQTNEIAQFQEKIAQLENANARLNSQLRSNQTAVNDLTIKLNQSLEQVQQLQLALAETNNQLVQITQTVEARIQQTEVSSTEKIDHIGKTINKTTLYWIIAFVLFAGIGYFLYRKLKGKLNHEKMVITENIITTSDQLKENLTETFTNKIDNLKYNLNNEIIKTTDSLKVDFNSTMNKTNQVLREEFQTNIKLTANAFDEQKVRIETEIKALKQETQYLVNEVKTKSPRKAEELS